MDDFDLYSLLLGESKEELKDWENGFGPMELVINKYKSSFLFVLSSIARVLLPVITLMQ